MKVSTEQVSEVTPPSVEPVSIAEAKLHGRIPGTSEDTIVSTYIKAARRYCENYLQRALAQRTLRANLVDFADTVELPFLPIDSITSIKYYDTSSPTVLVTLEDNSVSPVVTDETYSLVNNVLRRNQNQTFPAVYPRADAVQITYVAGYAPQGSPASYAPDNVKSAMLLLIQDMYENREAHITGLPSVRNRTLDKLLDFERVYR